MRKYKGLKADSDCKVIGESLFTVFGEMADGTKCWHEVVDGEEIEDFWYSCFIVNGTRVFVLEGIA